MYLSREFPSTCLIAHFQIAHKQKLAGNKTNYKYFFGFNGKNGELVKVQFNKVQQEKNLYIMM